jgi:hypothetical protein
MYQAEFHMDGIPKDATTDFILANRDATMASFRRLHRGFDEGVLAGLMESCIRDKGKNCAMAEVADKPGNANLTPSKRCQTRSWTTSKLVLDAQQMAMHT